MEKEQFDSLTGMRLDPPPLIYLHEHFKAYNEKSSTPLKNNWVWYSTEDLEDILKLIDEIKNKDPNKKGDGVRLYYGIYNDAVCRYLGNLPNGRNLKNHTGHNTVMFVPTYEGLNQDEHIDDINPVTAEEYRENYKKGLELPSPLEGGYNVGHICPPPKTSTGECANPSGAVL